MKQNLGKIVKQSVIALLICVLILTGLLFIWLGVYMPKHLSPLDWVYLLLWVALGALMICGGIKFLQT